MPPARLLDLTRTLRRAGRVATGVDRVELAYLSHLMAEEVPLFGLVRTPVGYLLLDSAGISDFRDKLQGLTPWGEASFLSRIVSRGSATAQRAESDLRRCAVARCLPGRLRAMLARHLPAGFDYFNVGHSNLTDRVLKSVKRAQGQVSVLIHDVIPLEYPQFQRAGTVAPFRAKVLRVAALADRVIYNSADTRERTEAQMASTGRIPPAIVSHLGTIIPDPDAKGLPDDLPPPRPYFITVGTIEPRKNHAFLLDLWEDLGPDAPPLLICGSRGWENHDVFARLDALPAKGPVREVAGLNDAALAYLVKNAAGALFPSHAEGFGLPPVEALALGTRVLCNDLAVLHEIMGDRAIFHSVSERKNWVKLINSWEKGRSLTEERDAFLAPTWADHFKTVLR